MLSKEKLKSVLIEQRNNLLAKPFGVERTALKEVQEKILLPHVIVITGIRRCGKSTILRQIAERFFDKTEFYYISFEDERLAGFDPKDFNDIYELQLELYGQKKTFLIDEIQNVPGFEAFVRRFQEMGFKLIITGSNANLLSRELGTKLTGRHVDVTIRPFSLAEYLSLKGLSLSPQDPYSTEHRARIKAHFEQYLISGGMPEHSISGDDDVLRHIYEDIVTKDILVRHNVENVAALKELYLFLISNAGNRFSLNSLKKASDVGSVNTIKDYLSYLEETFLGLAICKFDHSLKKRLVNDKKFYVADNGFIKVLSTKITPDRGTLLENLVFTTMASGHEVMYYANAGECDFTAFDGRRPKAAVQATLELTDENRDREVSGLELAMGALDLKEGLIITMDQEEEIERKGRKIKIVPAWKWLLF